MVDGRVVSSDVVRGDLRYPRTTSLDTTRPSTIFYRLLLNVMLKLVGTTIHN
jgi:hypothetical protein